MNKRVSRFFAYNDWDVLDSRWSGPKVDRVSCSFSTSSLNLIADSKPFAYLCVLR